MVSYFSIRCNFRELIFDSVFLLVEGAEETSEINSLKRLRLLTRTNGSNLLKEPKAALFISERIVVSAR